MKSKLISLFFLLFFFSCSCNRATPEVRAYRRAVRFGAKAKLTLHVVDENGMSINGAKCHVGFSNMARTLRSVDGMSDEKGFFTAQGKAQWHIGGNVQKEGFYQQQFEFLDYGRMERLEKGRWMP